MVFDCIVLGEIDFDVLVEECGLIFDDVDFGDVVEIDFGVVGVGVFVVVIGDVVGLFELNFGLVLFCINVIFVVENIIFE